ncbi:MAG: hypothetical protein HY711_01410 [Candidatus Melainabacteria bacterium]|nr:hypothetical protein [Candidatus Melainabacteria bacterium]
MSKQDDEIEEKLAKLEATISQDSRELLSVPSKSAEIVPVGGDTVKSDLYLIAGFGLLLTGLFLVFNHVHLGTGFLSWFGLAGQGFGLILIPLVAGIGLILYDHKKRLGWMLTAASVALLLFAILSQLVMTFPPMSLLGLIIMLLPFAFGGALLMKSFEMRKSSGQ